MLIKVPDFLLALAPRVDEKTGKIIENGVMTAIDQWEKHGQRQQQPMQGGGEWLS